MINSPSIRVKGELVSFDSPKIMGIINATPDSFYSKSRVSSVDQSLHTIEKMIEDGADFIDIGGYSSRPGAADVTEEEELKRVIPLLEAASKKFPQIILSIDTFRSSVGKAAIEAGAHMINDISGGDADALMFQTVKDLSVPYIAMHMQRTPKNMQVSPTYKNVTQDVFLSLSKKLNALRKSGVADVILDLGFGFGKSLEHNYQLLKNMDYFQSLDQPMLAGISRKSMIYKALKTTPAESLNGTSALHMIALQKGANILRVHDVKEAKEVVTLYSLMNL